MGRVSLAIYLVILVAGTQERFWPLVGFQLALGALFAYLRWRPCSRWVPILGHWFGPYPRLGERRWAAPLFAAVLLFGSRSSPEWRPSAPCSA